MTDDVIAILGTTVALFFISFFTSQAYRRNRIDSNGSDRNRNLENNDLHTSA